MSLSQIKKEDIKMAQFNIGDKVITYSGLSAIVTDKMYSEKMDKHLYSIQFDGKDIEEDDLFEEDELQKDEPAEYEVLTDINQNEGMVIVTIIEIKGSTRNLVARGHGHMLRRDALGITQATSYAARRALLSINNDSVNVEKE
jgi:hypothetical protein